MKVYNDGFEAAQDGKEHWENPHSMANRIKEDFHKWYAGWCYGKKQQADAWKHQQASPTTKIRVDTQ